MTRDYKNEIIKTEEKNILLLQKNKTSPNALNIADPRSKINANKLDILKKSDENKLESPSIQK